MSELIDLENKINYKFLNQELLREALSHPSLRSNKDACAKDNQRFELFGDAILNYIITEFLFHSHQNYDEGLLAKTRSYLISKEVLSTIGLKLNIGKYILMTRSEENSGGRLNRNIIEDAIEALIAAIFLDGGLEAARQAVLTLWQQELNSDFSKNNDVKSALQELSQSIGWGVPRYETIHKAGPEHAPHFQVKVTADCHQSIGEGSNIKEAEKHAAKKLLIIVEKFIANEG